MSQDIRHLVPTACDLLALGEPTHGEPAFPLIRNELFAQLTDLGFRSIALETDRVAALTVDGFVRGETADDLESVMRKGFSHGFGNLDANRQLVVWIREYNRNRSPQERLAFHGVDVPTETAGAPSPRPYLEHARDYLGLDLDIAGLTGDDERWNRTEAVMDPTMSVGAGPEAAWLRTFADDMLTDFHTQAPDLIAATSRAAWFRATTHLTAGLGLLRYHRAAAEPLEEAERTSHLLGVRDAIMAQNLLDVRDVEAGRGPTLVHAHNLHLQGNPSRWHRSGLEIRWSGAGSIVKALIGERYSFVAGSLGRSEALRLQSPEPGTHENFLDDRVHPWGLTEAVTNASAQARSAPPPEQGYFPLDGATLTTADAVLHVADGSAAAASL